MNAEKHAGLCLALALVATPALARQAWVHVEEQILIGSDTNAGDWLGSAVAIDGNTVIVGAQHADPNERGAAYVFVRTNGGWSQQQKLTAAGAVADFDHFGASVALQGDTAVIGAPGWGSDEGRAYLFQRSGSTWSAGQVLGTGWPNDFFGTAVAIESDHLAVSAPGRGVLNEGAIAIYTAVAGTWTFRTWILSAYPEDDNRMGSQIALVEAAPGLFELIASSTQDGAEIYEGSGSSWNYVSSIVAQFGGFFVEGVAVSSTTLVAGMPYRNTEAGRVAVYTFTPTGIAQQAMLQASDAQAYDHFGESVALDGDVIVVGAPFAGDQFGPDIGAAYVFERVGTTWHERARLAPSAAGPSDNFGTFVALDGSTAVIGAPLDSHAQGMAAGSAYVERIGFPSVSYCTAGVSSGNCVATMSSTGTPSASLSTPFSLQASNVDGQRFGLIFYGASGPSAVPWGTTSFLCVKSPLQRSRAGSSGGTVGSCDGVLALDWNAFAAQHPTALGQPFAPGQELWAQTWYRDPASLKTTQLSDALAFVMQP